MRTTFAGSARAAESPSPMSLRRVSALVVAVVTLAASTTLANRVLPGWAYPVCGLVAAVILVVLGRAAGCTWTDLGLSRLRRPALAGLAGAGLMAVVFGIALAVPALRTVYQDGRVGDPDFGQLLWLTCGRILFGTVLIEEIAFRGVLPGLFGATDERWSWPPILCCGGAVRALARAPGAGDRPQRGGPRGVRRRRRWWCSRCWPWPRRASPGSSCTGGATSGRGVLASVIVHFTTNAGGLTLAVLVR